MRSCTNCQSIIPENYESCPVCGSTEFKQIKRKVRAAEQIDDSITEMVIAGEIRAGELEWDAADGR